MIDQIKLTNFKCFKALDLDLAPLTLLTGLNAGGKSTATQTLLLLGQTLRGPRNSDCLLLNGPVVNLGTPADILNVNSGSKQMSLGAQSGEDGVRWYFEVADGDRRLLGRSSRSSRCRQESDLLRGQLDGIRPPKGVAGAVLSRLECLIYLSAGRQVETEVFPSWFGAGAPAGDVGPIGQFAAWWLHEMGDQELTPARRHPDAQRQLAIRQQVNAWIDDLFPGAEANAVPVQQTNLMRLQAPIRDHKRLGPTCEHRLRHLLRISDHHGRRLRGRRTNGDYRFS